MATQVTFRPYSSTDKETCLGIFDANCPEFFAPNERADYAGFLDGHPANYELCVVDEHVVGAFGLSGDGSHDRRLNWILISPSSHGAGIGSAIMERVASLAHDAGLDWVAIAASHKSAPFFARFGAVAVGTFDDGWGPGMHRIDMELRP
ncbi:MAG: GNAT family N-acetyltransferase [Rhodanobacter sp.]